MNQETPARPDPSIWSSLSLLRFFLAAVVASAHVKSFYNDTLTGLDPVRIFASLNGHAAVVGFLLVSGFSIAHSIRAESRQYLWRRVLRIYPLYIPAVLFTAWVGGYEMPGNPVTAPIVYASPNATETIGNLLMLQCVLVPPMSNNGPLWTLSLEWWCYMAAPALVLLSQRRLLLLLVLAAFAHLSWLAFASSFGFYGRCMYGLHIVFLGVFWLAGFCHYEMRDRAWSAWALPVFVWLLTGINRDNLGSTSQVTLALSTIALIAGHRIPWPAWSTGTLRMLGNVSYPLYLLHMPVYHLLYEDLGLRRGWQIFSLTLLITLATYLLMEIPLRKLMKMMARPRFA